MLEAIITISAGIILMFGTIILWLLYESEIIKKRVYPLIGNGLQILFIVYLMYLVIHRNLL